LNPFSFFRALGRLAPLTFPPRRPSTSSLPDECPTLLSRLNVGSPLITLNFQALGFPPPSPLQFAAPLPRYRSLTFQCPSFWYFLRPPLCPFFPKSVKWLQSTPPLPTCHSLQIPKSQFPFLAPLRFFSNSFFVFTSFLL